MYENEAAQLRAWIQQEVADRGAAGALVGLSGGIDSATVAVLLGGALPGRSLGVLMPCHSDPADLADGALAARAAGVETVTVDLSGTYDAFVEAAGAGAPALAAANVKPRLRMMTLYHQAASRGYLVVGTGNRTELELGYFTKYGDGGVDLLPLGEYLKTEVRGLAAEIGVPEAIIKRPPSAGLWPGQTDEGELGMDYGSIDRYLASGEGDPALAERIEALRARSAHKRETPPVFGRPLRQPVR